MTGASEIPGRCRKLAEAVRNRFDAGIDLGESVRHFIESTVAEAEPETVAEVLAAPSEFGAEPLMELIFFPDEAQQIALEPLLEAEPFGAGEEASVLAALDPPPLAARLRLEWTGTEHVVPVPGWVAGDFLRRLHIGYRPEARILAALDRFLEPAEALRFRVRFRNARFVAAERTIRLLERFLERYPGGAPKRRSAFDFLLGFLPGIPESGSVYGALLHRKRRVLRALAQARDDEARRRKSNMEILLMQGFRTGHVDVAAAERELVLLDEIAEAVFERIPAAAMEEIAEAAPVGLGDLDALAERFSAGEGP